jgi:1-aminocyclopropane-1-carboxylate deaminase/D-cysteine desulfhydrase-like pyridoxal-dependent ACC family enzyme
MARAPEREHDASASALDALTRRFPPLARVPRVRLGVFPTPLESLEAVARGLWVKREDLGGEPLGGNKVRSLEFLLAGVRAGDRVTTVGAAGSTHVLATATYARRLGARPIVYRWGQEMNATAREVAARLEREVGEAPLTRSVAGAYLRALTARLRGAHWVPAGGSAPLGILGQINAGLELVDQIHQSSMPAPDRIVVPLGTGGTSIGIALGAAIGALETEVVAVRVVPRIVANRRRLRRLGSRTARMLGRLTGSTVAPPVPIRIVHEFFGGAYGRSVPPGEDAARRLSGATGIATDPTYSAKALAAAIGIAEREGGTTLFWLSFDGRWLPPSARVALR